MTATTAPAPTAKPTLQKVFSWTAIVLTVLIFAQPILAGMGLDGDSAALTMHRHNGFTIIGVAAILVIVALIWKLKGGPAKALGFAALLLVLNLAMFAIGEIGTMQALHLPLGVATLLGSVQVITMGFRYRGEATTSDDIA